MELGEGAAGLTIATATVAANNIFESTNVQQIANAWLDLLETHPYAGYAAHVSMSLLTCGLQASFNPLVMQRNAEWVHSNTALGSANARQWDWTNQMLSLFLQPSISGIPIICQEEDSTRTVDVSEEPLIVQKEGSSTEYVTDNSVARPRDWTLHGYIMAWESSTAGLLNNPALNLIRAVLDLFAKSGRPVLYKGYDMIFRKASITQYSWKYNANVQNGVEVTIGLKEFVPAETLLSGTTSVIMELLG